VTDYLMNICRIANKNKISGLIAQLLAKLCENNTSVEIIIVSHYLFKNLGTKYFYNCIDVKVYKEQGVNL